MRTKKAFKNLLFSLVQQIVLIATNFLMPPILIANFGSAINGLVSTVRQIMAYVQLTGAGISSASTFAMYKPLANKDYKTLSGIYNATKIMFNKAGNAFSIICLLVSLIYPLTVSQEVDYMIVALLVLVISISGASEFYMSGKYQAILNANQENYVVAIAQIIGNITNLVFLIALVKLKQNIIIVQLGMSSIYLLRIIVLSMYVKKHYKFIDKLEKPLFNLISQRNHAIVHQVSSLVVLGSSTLIVSVVRGLEEASVFTVYSMIFQAINVICSIISNSIYASFGDIIAKKEHDTLKKSFNIYEFGYFIIVTIVFVCTYVLIMPFISIYTKNLVDVNYILPTLATLFIIVGVANNIRIPANTVVIGAGHFMETKNKAIVEMVLNVLGQFLFGILWGLNGVLLGCIISYSYRTLDFIIYANKKIIKQSSKKSFFRILVNAGFGIFLSIFLKRIITLEMSGYVEWIIYATMIFFITSLLVLLVNVLFDRKTFKDCIGVVKSLF